MGKFMKVLKIITQKYLVIFELTWNNNFFFKIQKFEGNKKEINKNESEKIRLELTQVSPKKK